MKHKNFDRKKIGMVIKQKRHDYNLSQAELAEMLDLSIVHVSHLENGKVNMSMKSLYNICHVLECTPNDILLPGFHLPANKSQEVNESMLDTEEQALIKHIENYFLNKHKS